MYSRRSFTQTIVKTNDIVYYICTDDLINLKNVVDNSNVNQIIDSKNRYTALHYAVKFNNISIINFLLSIGANPYLKNNENLDCFNLSFKYHTTAVYDNVIKTLKDNVSDLNKKITTLEKKIDNDSLNTKYLIKSIDDSVIKIDNLKNDNYLLKKDNSTLKSKNNLLNKENDNLTNAKKKLEKIIDDNHLQFTILKSDNSSLTKECNSLKNEVTSLKRKYDDLDDSYTGLLNKIQKK